MIARMVDPTPQRTDNRGYRVAKTERRYVLYEQI